MSRTRRPPSILLDRAQPVAESTLDQVSSDATHRSRSSMAQRSGLSKSTVGRICRSQLRVLLEVEGRPAPRRRTNKEAPALRKPLIGQIRRINSDKRCFGLRLE